MKNLSKEHCKEVKWILMYLKGATTQALCLRGSNIVLHGYVDLNMVGDIYSRSRTTWYVFTVGGTTIRWIYKL